MACQKKKEHQLVNHERGIKEMSCKTKKKSCEIKKKVAVIVGKFEELKKKRVVTLQKLAE